MYEKLFKTWTGRSFLLGNLTRAYKLTFNMSHASQVVMKDLGDYCRANHPEGTFDPDPYKHALYEGRRQVWQRILNHLHLEDGKIMALYMDHQINPDWKEDE